MCATRTTEDCPFRNLGTPNLTQRRGSCKVRRTRTASPPTPTGGAPACAGRRRARRVLLVGRDHQDVQRDDDLRGCRTPRRHRSPRHQRGHGGRPLAGLRHRGPHRTGADGPGPRAPAVEKARAVLRERPETVAVSDYTTRGPGLISDDGRGTVVVAALKPLTVLLVAWMTKSEPEPAARAMRPRRGKTFSPRGRSGEEHRAREIRRRSCSRRQSGGPSRRPRREKQAATTGRGARTAPAPRRRAPYAREFGLPSAPRPARGAAARHPACGLVRIGPPRARLTADFNAPWEAESDTKTDPAGHAQAPVSPPASPSGRRSAHRAPALHRQPSGRRSGVTCAASGRRLLPRGYPQVA